MSGKKELSNRDKISMGMFFRLYNQLNPMEKRFVDRLDVKNGKA